MEELFNKYTEAFNAFDPQAIASLYRLPCAISDADGVQTFTQRAALVKKFTSNCESMRNVGYQHAQFSLLEQHALGDDKVAATVAWRVVIDDSNVDFRTLYICHFVDNEWLVFNANVYQGTFSNAPRGNL
jgi:ketosteroid isomerase-like protein